MHRPLIAGALLLLSASPGLASEASRTLQFTYEVIVPAREGAPASLDVFLPLATSDANQSVLEQEVQASLPGMEGSDATYGNRFWHGHLDAWDGSEQHVTVELLVERRIFRRGLAGLEGRPLTEAEREQHALFLGANSRVPVDGELIEGILAELDLGDAPPLQRARRIYDYVVDTMEYRKTGTGWGNGDTYWACSERYGNCTDFHALFLSLARSQGIPARFEIGFPVPLDKPEGSLGGYHCWVEFFIGGIGWIPIDASEAKKHPELRDLLFGSHPADRIQLTVGRDLQLGEGHRSGPLNYFVYPLVEVDGERLEGVETRFRYAEPSPTSSEP